MAATVIESVLEAAGRCTFDVRTVGCPDDPLRHLFPDWVPYYRLKAALAAVLAPRSILEVGVRYGYSAAAFLHGCPDARYLGLDNDSDTFGGVPGALDYARAHLGRPGVEFLAVDTQALDELPGGPWDLIHVDGQQDGDGTCHDLELALRQGRFVLVDGYLWNGLNFRAVNEFLFSHREALVGWSVIPGYSGELLLQVAAGAPARAPRPARRSGDVRSRYSASYYLCDCGGFDTFGAAGVLAVQDPRLVATLDLAFLERPASLLDLGAGRGELAFAAAARGVRVTAVDYSPQAVELATAAFVGHDRERELVDLRCGDVTAVPLQETYDVALACDLLEHLADEEAERLVERVARHLGPRGRFVVHTSPNRWSLDFDYPRRRRLAAALGAWLPAEPRTWHEQAVHLNEQSPAVLSRRLRRWFPHVALWFAEPGAAAGSLGQRWGRRELVAARDLWAVASHAPVAEDALRRALSSAPLGPWDAERVRLEVLEAPVRAASGRPFVVTVRVSNGARGTLASHPPNPVNLAYHWLDPAAGVPLVFEGRRTPLAPRLPPGQTDVYRAVMSAPTRRGTFVLQVRLVQEHVRWFEAGGADRTVDVG